MSKDIRYQKSSEYVGRYFNNTLLIDIIDSSNEAYRTPDAVINDPLNAITFVHEYSHFVCLSSTLLGVYLRYLHQNQLEMQVRISFALSQYNHGELPSDCTYNYIEDHRSELPSDIVVEFDLMMSIKSYINYLITGKIINNDYLSKAFDCTQEAEYGINALLENYAHAQEILSKYRHYGISFEILTGQLESNIDSGKFDLYTVYIKHVGEIVPINLPVFVELCDFALMGIGKLKQLAYRIDDISAAIQSTKKLPVLDIHEYLMKEIFTGEIFSRKYSDYLCGKLDEDSAKNMNLAPHEMKEFETISKANLSISSTYRGMISLASQFSEHTPDVISKVDLLLSMLGTKFIRDDLSKAGASSQNERVRIGLKLRKVIGPLMAQYPDSVDHIRKHFIPTLFYPTISVNGKLALPNKFNQDLGALVFEYLLDELWIGRELIEEIECPLKALDLVCDLRGRNYCKFHTIMNCENICIVEEKLLPWIAALHHSVIKKYRLEGEALFRKPTELS